MLITTTLIQKENQCLCHIQYDSSDFYFGMGLIPFLNMLFN